MHNGPEITIGVCLDAYIGEIAGLATSFMFSLSSTFFSLAGENISSIVLNRVRLIFAILLIAAAHWILRIPLPLRIGSEPLIWLGLSGAIGLAFGDLLLYEGYAKVGPRLTMLMLSLSPVLSALLAALFLSERLSPGQILGILVTIGGIAWVVAERNGSNHQNGVDQSKFRQGILFGLGAAVAQALGQITAKRGLSADFPALSASLIRVTSAGLVLWTITLVIGQVRATAEQIVRESRSLIYVLCGAMAGPLFGVTFSLIALQRTKVGVASTLMALPPVILLPISYFVFKERFGWQAILGTLVAMGGVAVLFLV